MRMKHITVQLGEANSNQRYIAVPEICIKLAQSLPDCIASDSVCPVCN